MKIVFDTNVYISGTLFKGGIPSQLLDLAIGRKFMVFISPDILEEIDDVLKIKFELTLNERHKILFYFEQFTNIVYPTEKLNITTDKDDNKILECAFESKAQFVITGDKKHLLSLKQKFPFQIVSPSTFYQNLHD